MGICVKQRSALRYSVRRINFSMNPRVFDDPVALCMIGKKEAAALQAGK